LANFGASSNSLATSLQLTPKSAGLDPQSTSRCPRKKTTAAACEKAVIQLEQQFQRIFADQHKNGRLDLEAVEMAIRSTVHQTGADAVTELLRWEPPDDTQRRMPCACGKEARYEGMRSRPILTVVGWARIERPYYLCPACKTGQFPADVQLDIDKTDFSPGVRRMLAAVGSETAFAPGRDQIKLLAGLAIGIGGSLGRLRPSHTTVRTGQSADLQSAIASTGTNATAAVPTPQDSAIPKEFDRS
jgi:hypothetical protein